ncbi:MAG: hypothetical protein AAF499_04550, partial [Pseudomonadota bacterium]
MTHANHPVGQLFDLIEGPIRFELVRWAIETGVFDRCHTPTDAGALALALETDPRRTERAMQALVSTGLVTHACGQYCTHPDFAPYLESESATCFSRTFLDLSTLRHRGLDALAPVIAGQDIQQQSSRLDSAHWQRMQASLVAFHQSVAVQAWLEALDSVPEWASAGSLLDVGGGSYHLAHRLVESRQDLTVTVFDLPDMIDNLGKPDHSRITAVPGNYHDESTLPPG